MMPWNGCFGRGKETDMFEKVNPCHPDKVADRIAGAIVDLAYAAQENPKVAVEVLIGHGVCHAIIETSAPLETLPIESAIRRIAGSVEADVVIVPQDGHLAQNQESAIRCGDNGIFKGIPVTNEQERLVSIAHAIYDQYPCDGKYILDGEQLVICQSNAISDTLRFQYPGATVNPLGDWTGGPDVDTGATNRKLGSDMADSVTGGGLHGKDLSKADVSVNIYAWLEAQRTGQPVEFCCAIGDELVGGVPYAEIVETARAFIKSVGGFEKFAEWGLA
jgi:S-adenosylmethionine synthetase